MINGQKVEPVGRTDAVVGVVAVHLVVVVVAAVAEVAAVEIAVCTYCFGSSYPKGKILKGVDSGVGFGVLVVGCSGAAVPPRLVAAAAAAADACPSWVREGGTARHLGREGVEVRGTVVGRRD